MICKTIRPEDYTCFLEHKIKRLCFMSMKMGNEISRLGPKHQIGLPRDRLPPSTLDFLDTILPPTLHW